MPFVGLRIICAVSAVLSLGIAGNAATFGTAVPVRGTVSDIALDESRSRLYIANFGAGRIEVMNTADPKFGLLTPTPFTVSKPPSAVALSPGNHYLVVGEYDAFNSASGATETGAVAIFDLDKPGSRQEITLPYPVLSVAFGAGNLALVVTKGDIRLLDPTSGRTQPLAVTSLGGAPLPVPIAICKPNIFSFPANVVEAATGVSGDQQTILILAELSTDCGVTATSDTAALLRYKVGNSYVEQFAWGSTPPLGPRTVSVNKDASRFVGGWVLMDSDGVDRADFPNLMTSAMDLRKGGHAFDYSRNLIYADIMASLTDAPVMHVMDSDNLTVRERIQLPQMMSGRSLFSSDMTTLYSGSDSGVLVLPVASLGTAHQLAASQEDVVFQSDICTRSVISHNIDLVDLGGGNIDFSLSLPAGTSGIRLSQDKGTTPATVRIDVDPTVFQVNAGTTTVMLSLQSSGAINIPFPVRLLINTRDLSQRGQIVNVPGKLVDIVADPVRNQVYVLRQDKNLVLVFDTTTWKQIAAPQLRTGNTPMSMAITPDQHYLLVGNDHSQLINTFDLNTLQPWNPSPSYPSSPFIRTDGAYPGSVAVGQGVGTPVVWAAVRDADPPTGCKGRALFRADFPAYFASAPASLGVYANCLTSAYSPAPMVAASPVIPLGQPLHWLQDARSVLLAEPDGTVGEWDGTTDYWVVSRQDVTTLGGAYGALTDAPYGDTTNSLFVTDNRVLDRSLFAIAQMETATGTSSGVGMGGNDGLRTTAATAAGPGTIERIDFNPNDGPYYLQTYGGTSTIEAPHTAASLQTPTVGQIGQTISAFTRTLAVPADQSSIVLLSQSGLTILPPDFDAATKVPVVTSVTNPGNGSSSVTASEQVLISGTGLAPGSAVAGTEPLPSTLGDACVTMGSEALPLFWVSPTQIKAVLPADASATENLIVHTPGGVSSPFTFQVQTYAPAILPIDSGSQAGLSRVVRQKNGEVVNFTNPIHAKDTISIFMTGLGPTVPAITPGDLTPASPPSLLVTKPAVTLGGTTLNVTFAGLAPGEVSVYRVDASVPFNIRGASQTPLVITQGSAAASIQVRVVNP